MKAVVWVSLLVALATVVLPSASAQGTQSVSVMVKIGPPEGLPSDRLAPEVGLAQARVQVTVVFPPLPTVCLGQYAVTLFIVEQPHYASAFLSPASFSGSVGGEGFVPFMAGGEQRTFISSLYVSTTRDAPAMADGTYKIKADVIFPSSVSGCLLTGGSAVASVAIKNDYVPLTSVDAERFTETGMTGVFTLDVTNLGNGPTRVSAVVTPDAPDAIEVVTPADLHLESRASRGPDAVYKATMSVPYVLHVQHMENVKVVITSGYDGAAEQTHIDETTLSLVAEPGDEPSDTAHPDPSGLPTAPGAGLWGSFLAMAAAGLMRRRA